MILFARARRESDARGRDDSAIEVKNTPITFIDSRETYGYLVSPSLQPFTR